jgi:CheY-like chemotaxis protein
VEATRRIRERSSHVEVVAFTSDEAPEVRERFVAAGASRVFHKAHPELLYDYVSHLLATGAGADRA